MLKGALTGAALGGIGGMLGNKFGIGGAGTKAGGLFGFGSKMIPNALALSGIGMGTEMLGQQEANAAALAGRRRWLDEEEQRRIDRLNKIAGYDVADSKNFLTPNKFFGLARGGIAQLPGYEMGGEVIDQMGEEVAMSQPHPDEGYYEMFFDHNGRYPKDREELEIFLEGMDLDTVQVARGGRVHARRGMYLPNEVEEGFQYDVDIDGDKYDFSFDEELTEDNDKKKKIIEMIMRQKIGEYEHPLGTPGMGEYENPIGTPGMGEYEHPLGRPGMGEYEFKAAGGIADLDMRSGGHSIGPGTGTSDDVPAMLSDGEFVVTAKAVENLGGGDRMEGAKRMYSMMNRLDPNSQTPGEMNYVGHG